MKDPVIAWATAALKGAATAKALRSKLDKRPSPLADRFGLDPLERRILDLTYAAERSFDVAKLARAAAGGLTVELVRAKLGDGVDAALSPRRPLRRHALVAVGAGGLPAASDLLRAAPGVCARLDGAAEPEALWLGIVRLVPNGRGDLAQRVETLLRDVDAAHAALVTLDGCPRREAHDLGAGLARHRGKGVLVVDGELLAGAPDPALLLACLRREADCEGDAIVVCEAAALGERWRALLAPPAGAPPLVLLADGARTRDPVAAAPFAVRRLSLHAPAPPTAAAPTAAEPARKEEAPPDDGLDHVRQQAIRDAERALGIYRAPPPPPRAPVAPTPAAAAAAPPPRPATPAPAPAPTEVMPPGAAAATARAAAAAAGSSSGGAASSGGASSAAAAPSSAAPPRMSAKAMQHFGHRFAKSAETPAEPPAAAPAAPPAAAPAASVEPPAAAPVAADTVDGPPLPLSANATIDELARAAATSPSASQRIELINRLRQHKTNAVVAALRANASNAHPGVRAAAEAAMAALFGPNWNATRPVPKPIQRPPSDDKDRGPPGGY